MTNAEDVVVSCHKPWCRKSVLMLLAVISNRDLDMDPGLQNPGALLGCSDHLALVVAGHLSADSLRIYT